jgi:hypothetical protein
LNVVSAGSELNLVAMPVENALHSVAEVKRAADGFSTLVVRGYPKSEKWSFHSTFTQTRQINHAVGQSLSNVDVFVNDVLDRVIMAVNAEHTHLKFHEALVLRLGKRKRNTCEQYQTHSSNR